MKKITLLLLLFCTYLGYGQLETFEAGIPSTWTILTGANGLGGAETWKINVGNSNFPAYQGTQAAYVNNVNVGINNTEEDWLITNQRMVPTNGQVQFYARQTIESDQNTLLVIRVSTNPALPTLENLANFTSIDTLSEGELNNLNGPIDLYKSHAINIPAAFHGQMVYVAFVRVYKQLTPARAGDRFLIDNVNILAQCNKPDNLQAAFATVYSRTAILRWDGPATATSFEVEVKPIDQNYDELQTDIVNTPPQVDFLKTQLIPETSYKYRVRTRCLDSEGNFYPSEWSTDFNFTTLPLGSVCQDPLEISALPYQVTGANTGFYGDEYDGLQGPGCVTPPSTTNYLAGAEVFYSYQATQSGVISVTMTPIGTASTNSSVFVYTGACTSITSGCVAGFANAATTVRTFNLNVTAGTTYYIVVSSSAATQTINYNLLIQQENCLPKPDALTATNPTTSGATLGWGNAGNYTSFQVQVQLLGEAIPSGAGADVITGVSGNPISFPKTGLNPATIYQYWVRAECTLGSGIFTSWAGPFVFNTLICDPADTCGYTFTLTDTGNNGWGTNRMQVRQNGIVVATLGTQIPTGGGPVEITVPLCPGVPFDLFWSATGTSPQQCGISIKNSFTQTLYTKPTNLNAVGTVLYSGIVKCDTPVCNLTPVNLAVQSFTTNSAIVTWESVMTTDWELYVVPSGSPAPPNSITTPVAPPGGFVYTGSAGENVVNIPGPLDADQAYDFYVRIPCSPAPSPWAGPGTFTTLPTCFKPTSPLVVPLSIGLTDATFTWVPGQPTDTTWELLLIPSQVPPPFPSDNPVIGPGAFLFPVNGTPTFTTAGQLTPATIYYAFVRTVCPGDDKSNWTPFTVFNTITCDVVDKCNYKFVLTNTGTNTWSGARMQIRQNGILITTIGAASINNANGIVVPLCKDVPFDVYWSVAGTSPGTIGLQVQNPFLDVIYTLSPGVATPLTVVYSGVTNCTPAPCSKPTVSQASVVAVNNPTSVVLTWTDNSSTPSTAYDLYVVTTGSAAPINFPATTPTVSGVTLSGPGNTYTLSTINGVDPLLPSTAYTFYVRAVCGPGETSTWTILTPVNFITKPLNDECAAAMSVDINDDQTCLPANNAPGNTLGATASLPILNPVLTGTGCGPTNRDVWYKFVAEHTSQTITLNDIVTTPATGVTLNFSVFSGTCDDLTKVNCYTANTAVLFGLTVGNTYYVRVYTAANTAAQSAKFNLCITSPPANDEPVNGKVVTVNSDWNCTSTTTGNTLGASPSTPTGVGVGCTTTDDDVWFQFVATASVHQINISDVIGSPTNAVTLSHAFLSGTPDALVNVYCSTALQSVAIGLTIGNTYYIRVYTTNSTPGQSATFNVCVNTPPPAGPNDECANAVNVPVNADSKCTLKTAGNIIGATASTPSTNCVGNENDDVWFSFVATGPRQIINILNVVGTTNNLNFAVYQGSCGALTQKYCSAANALANVSPANSFVEGQTYYLRIWSNSDLNQAVTFDVCIKSISTCENAGAICGASEDDPIIYENVTGLPDNSQVACLGSIPNPTFYTIRVGQTGPLFFDILQYESFDANGQPQGEGLDVDYVCWGPFTSAESCNQISFTDCPTCPNNQTNPNFYPFGNIVDCSYSGFEIETLSIPNAQEGEFYILLVTNFENDPGFIKLVQTNFTAPTAGATTCCDVNLGDPIIEVCAEDYELNAQFATDPNAELPTDYKWYLLPSTTPIPGATAATYTATVSGTYKVEAQCGINTVDDTVQLILGPVINVLPQADYIICDDISNDGVELFNLQPYLTSVLTGLTGTYVVTIHPTEIAANGDSGVIDVSNPISYGNTTVYIRIESAALSTCYSVVPLNLIVAQRPNPEFNYDPIYCQNATPNPSAAFTSPSVVGTFDATPAGLVFLNNATGEINLAASTPNVAYTITFTVTQDPLIPCGVISFVDTVTIVAIPEFTLTGVKDICPNDQTTVQVVVSNNTFVLGTATYKWFKGTDEIIGQTGSSLLINGQADWGNYKVVVDNQGCISEQTFVIGDANTDWGVSIVSTDNELCGTETAVLTVNIANNTNGAPVSYTYTLPDASQVTSTSNTLPISVFGVYSVTVDILGCQTTAAITIAEGIADWQVNFGGPYVICPGQPVNLSFTATNFDINDVNAVYTWTSPNGTQTNGATLNGATEVGQYTLNIDISGCKNDLFVNVTANTTVIAISLEDGCEGQEFIVRALPLNGSFDPLTSDYEWSGTGFSTTLEDNAVVITSKGVVTVKVTNDQGCFGTATFDSTNINLGCVIQKGISPNNNGENDTFDLSGYNVAKLAIFNRYGTEVYQFKNYVNQWGGQSNSGDELPDGTYFYVIDLVGGGTKNGWIYINR